jgi:hypothetical protein
MGTASIFADVERVCGKAFNTDGKLEYLEEHVAKLDALASGDCISAKLVLPAQMGQYDVRICKRKIKENRMLVRIELDSWFLRLFTPHIEAEFDLNTGRPLRYQGVSMISDETGKTVEVLTTYDYPQQPSLYSSRFKQVAPAPERN